MPILMKYIQQKNSNSQQNEIISLNSYQLSKEVSKIHTLKLSKKIRAKYCKEFVKLIFSLGAF